MPEYSQLAENVKKYGITRIENWLKLEDQQIIEKIITSIKPKKGSKKSWVAINNKSIILKLLKLDIKAVFNSIYFTKLANRLDLNAISDQIFSHKSELAGIDMYYNPISNSPILDWHCDQAYSGSKDVKNFVEPEDFAIKFFFYLTDVNTNNGCLSYIPESHKVAYALKKGIYNNHIKYAPYWNIKDFKKIILDNKNIQYLRSNIEDGVLERVLNKIDLILNNSNENLLFDNKMDKGGAVIFNESGIHRGSKNLFSDRMCLRYFYKKKY